MAEHDIAINSGPLRAKLLVFKNRRALCEFWRRGMNKIGFGASLGFGCLGVVNALAHEIITVRPGKSDLHRIEVDPRYFCVIGIVAHVSALGSAVEVLTHEATHAAFAYAKRVRLRDMWPNDLTNAEESVCYPVGRIARRINIFMAERKLW